MLIIRILSFNLFFVEGYLPICLEKNMKIDIGYQRESIKLNFCKWRWHKYNCHIQDWVTEAWKKASDFFWNGSQKSTFLTKIKPNIKSNPRNIIFALLRNNLSLSKCPLVCHWISIPIRYSTNKTIAWIIHTYNISCYRIIVAEASFLRKAQPFI